MKSSDAKWDFIENVVYINLDKRTDRREHMEKMTSCFGDKVHRFSAIEDVVGIRGCAKSHIAVLEMALDNNWKNVLVLEDDAEWNDSDKGYLVLKDIVKKKYDVIILGGNKIKCYEKSYKLISSWTTVGYLINNDYFSTLLENFKEGLDKNINEGKTHENALDIYWNKLQIKDNWYTTLPVCIYQKASYSDIENMDVDYSNDMLSSINLISEIDKKVNSYKSPRKLLTFLKQYN